MVFCVNPRGVGADGVAALLSLLVVPSSRLNVGTASTGGGAFEADALGVVSGDSSSGFVEDKVGVFVS